MKTLIFLLLVLPPSWILCAPNHYGNYTVDPDDDTSGATDTDDDTSGATDTDDDTSGASDTDDDTSGATDTDDDTSGATDTDDDTSGATDTDDVDDDDLPQCYSESTSSRYTLGCADGNEAQRWDGCIDIQSYRDRCPKYHFPCNELRDNGIEFKCGTDCLTNGGGGKRSDCINKTKCYSESSSSSDTLGCASGNEAPRWNGCILEGSYRVRCPYGYYPCNDLRDNGKEFKCGTDCSTLGGKRIDCIDEDRPTCYSEPTSSDDQLECADGTFASLWDGCINKDSYRVRCPKGYLPCIDIRENGKEFMCGTDCSTKGGKRRDCIND